MYEENFGSLSPYKDYSIDIEKYNHPYWQKSDLQKEVLSPFLIYGVRKILDLLLNGRQLYVITSVSFYNLLHYLLKINYNFSAKTNKTAIKINEEFTSVGLIDCNDTVV